MFKIVLLIGLTGSVSAYYYGIPAESCDSGVAGFVYSPQTTPPPFKFNLDRNRIHAGDTVKFSIRLQSPSYRFQGFLIQVRSGAGGKRLGTFIVDPNDRKVQTVDCENVKNSAVTNRPNGGIEAVTVTWSSPQNFKGTVRFYTIIIRDRLTYWLDIPSREVTIE